MERNEILAARMSREQYLESLKTAIVDFITDGVYTATPEEKQRIVDAVESAEQIGDMLEALRKPSDISAGEAMWLLAEAGCNEFRDTEFDAVPRSW